MLPHDSVPELVDTIRRVSNLEQHLMDDYSRLEKRLDGIDATLKEVNEGVKKTNGRVTRLEYETQSVSKIWADVKAFGLIVAGALSAVLGQHLFSLFGR